MIPSETNETPFQISRCKGGKEKRKRKEKKRNTIVVRLSLIYSSAVVAITMAIDRACSPPVRVPGLRRWKKKKKRRSYPRNETNVPIYELDHVFFKLPILVFSITIGEKKEPAAIVHSIFRIDQTFLSIVSLFTRENEDRPIRDSTRVPYFAN